MEKALKQAQEAAGNRRKQNRFRRMFGRETLYTSVSEITEENLLDVLNRVLPLHTQNRADIDYLWRYMRGDQPILRRTKKIRPEIMNRIVENHANAIARFVSGYFLGEPCAYVQSGTREGAADDIAKLNGYMAEQDKDSQDKELSSWLAICGVGYRMVLPRRSIALQDDSDSPFLVDTPDPRDTFVVYHSGFKHPPVLGAQLINVDESDKEVIFGYTRTHSFCVDGNVVTEWKPHILGGIPIFEYNLNMAKMGSFEPALTLLDALNTIASNRVDGLEQFVQSFVKFINCDIDEATFQAMKDLGAIKVKSVDGQHADVDIVASELNQEQVQQLVDYIYSQVMSVCGLPTTTKGGSSTSDTGAAVILRDGWAQMEAFAKDMEGQFRPPEMRFLRMVLRMLEIEDGTKLKASEIELKFTRRHYENLLSKTQALIQMLQAGLDPKVAIASCGLFSDPIDVARQSEKYLARWEPSGNAGDTNAGENPPAGAAEQTQIETERTVQTQEE